MAEETLQEGKRYRHKWTKGNRRYTTCKVCGCEKTCLGLYPEYKLGSERLKSAPNCIKDEIKLTISGQFNFRAFVYALGGEIDERQIDYLIDKDLIGYKQDYKGDLSRRHSCGSYCLTNKGILTFYYYNL